MFHILFVKIDHLNGLFQDTSEFAKSLYTDDGGANYAKFLKMISMSIGLNIFICLKQNFFFQS